MRVLPYIALLILAGILAYRGTMSYPFVFDDKPAILDNRTIRHFDMAVSPPGNGSSVTGRPLVNLSFAVNHAISGEAVWSYHVLNLLIHIGSGLVLFGLLRRTLQLPTMVQRLRDAATSLAFAVALLWLVHPLQTESVTSIVQRTESLVGLLYLATLYGFVRSLAATARVQAWRGISVLVCLGGMATKEVMATAPLLVLLYDRTFAAGSFGAAWRLRRGYYLGLAGTWLLLGTLVFSAGGTRGEAAGFGLGVTPWNYALTQCHALLLYLKLSFWPQPLVFDYGTVVAKNFASVWLQVLGVVLLVAGTITALVRRPAMGFLCAGFLLILAPSSSVVPLVSQTIAEHRMYLPLAAIITLVVLGAYLRLGWPVLLISCVIAPFLLMLTMQRNRDYRTELALWSDTVAKVPDNARARINLAEILIEMGQPAEALVQAGEAVRLRPGYAEAQTNLGIALAQLGRLDEALGPSQRAVELQPDYVRGRSNLGVVLAQLGDWTEAIAQFNAALLLASNTRDEIPIQGNLAKALLGAGRLPEAIAQFMAVLQAEPDSVEVRYNLAQALGRSGRMAEAEIQLENVLRLQPNHVRARRMLEGMLEAR